MSAPTIKCRYHKFLALRFFFLYAYGITYLMCDLPPWTTVRKIKLSVLFSFRKLVLVIEVVDCRVVVLSPKFMLSKYYRILW